MTEPTRPCGTCGMPCTPGEYHPYAACLMFKACHNSETVRANLEAVRGTPPAVAGEPDYATFALWYADHIGDENKPVRDAALATYEAFATPQPAKAPAGAVPLTDDELLAMWTGGDERFMRPVLGKNKVLAFGRAVEHRIKGGQHGTE